MKSLNHSNSPHHIRIPHINSCGRPLLLSPDLSHTVLEGHYGEIMPLKATLNKDWWVHVLFCPPWTETQVPQCELSLKHPLPAAFLHSLSSTVPYWHFLGSLPKESTCIRSLASALPQNKVFTLESFHQDLLPEKAN